MLANQFLRHPQHRSAWRTASWTAIAALLEGIATIAHHYGT
jgi:hypothetical protein